MTNISTKWAVEQVPDDAYLFVRVHKSKIEQKNAPTIGIPKAGAFKNTPETGPDLSSDWNKYSTPQQSREQIGKEYRHGKEEFKNPSDFYIVSFKVQDIFDLDLSKKLNIPQDKIIFQMK